MFGEKQWINTCMRAQKDSQQKEDERGCIANTKRTTKRPNDRTQAARKRL